MSTPDIMAVRIAELEEQVADQARWIAELREARASWHKAYEAGRLAGLAEGLELASKARRLG